MDVFLKFVFIKESSDWSALCGLLGDKCLIASSCLQDQYCPYGLLQFPLGSKTTPSGGK